MLAMDTDSAKMMEAVRMMSKQAERLGDLYEKGERIFFLSEIRCSLGMREEEGGSEWKRKNESRLFDGEEGMVRKGDRDVEIKYAIESLWWSRDPEPNE